MEKKYFSISDDMKIKMEEMEKKIKEQSENLIKFSELAYKKEEKLNIDISKYLKEISELKNEMELLNGRINNLKEEKENNDHKISELIKENEELKKLNSIKIPISNFPNLDKKKYEDYIKILKNNILNLEEEKKNLEEVVIKQEKQVFELSSNCNNVDNLLKEKEIEIKNNLALNNKLSNTISFHKKEIEKLKYNNLIGKSSSSDILFLKNEIKNMKKEIENKENKINLLSKNNKILQGKVNKLQNLNNNNYYNISPIHLQISQNKINNILNDNNNDDNKLEDYKEKKNKYYIYAKNIKKEENNNEINYNNGSISSRLKKEKKLNFNEIKEKYEKERENQRKRVDEILKKNKSINKMNNSESEVNINIDPIINKDKSLNNINNDITINENNKTLRPQKEEGISINISQEIEYPVIESYVVLNEDNNDLNNNNVNNFDNSNLEEEDTVKKLHNCVDKILNEF